MKERKILDIASGFFLGDKEKWFGQKGFLAFLHNSSLCHYLKVDELKVLEQWKHGEFNG